MRRRLRQLPLPLAGWLVLALALTTAAVAYFTTTGSGTAAGSVTTLSAPASPAASVAATTVTVTWNASTIGGSLAAGSYTVERYGSTGTDLGAASCSPVSSSSGNPNAFGSFSCTDSPSAGTYKYVITAAYHQSWSTASGFTNTVVVQNQTSTSASAPATGTTSTAIAAASITATLSGAGTGAGGTITYTVFGPQSSAPSTCTSGGTTVGTASVSGNGTYSSSAAYTPSAAGTYWWYVSYGGDTNNSSSHSTCGSGMTSTVVKNATTLTASAPASGSAGTAIAASSITSGLAGGTAGASGTITYTVFGPQSTAPATCTSGGTTVGTASVSGNGTYSSSAAYTPSTAGTYWWYASYGGDASNKASASTCGAGMASTVVAKATTTLTAAAPNSDSTGTAIGIGSLSAALSGATSGASGTVTFTVFGPQSTAPATCTSGGTTVGTASVSGSGTYNPSAGYTPSTAGTYWWYASYNGDSNNNSSHSTCGAGMTSTAVKNTTTITTSGPSTDMSNTAISASSITSTLSGGASGVSGTVTYTVFGPQNTAPTTCTSGGTTVGTSTVSGNGNYSSSASFTPASAGTYWWYASYGGDTNDSTSNSGCGAGMASTFVYSASSVGGTSATGGNSATTSSFTVSPSTTYLLLVFRSSSSGDGISSIASTGLTPALSTASFRSITSQSYNTSTDYQWAYWITTASNASGTGTIKATFTNSLSAGSGEEVIDLVKLGGVNPNAPVVTSNQAVSTGSSATATANLPNAPSASDPGLVFLTGANDLGTSAPAASPTMTSSYFATGYVGVYTDGAANRNESFTLGSTGQWGTIGLELNSPTGLYGNTTTTTASGPSTGTAGTPILGSAISATLSGGASDAGGTITYTVFGPQASAPATCTSGGTTVGTASAFGNGTYSPSASFTPSSAGTYWWYASYGGDASDQSSASTCGSGMASTVVGTAPTTTTVSAPSTDEAGTAISAGSVSSTLSGGVNTPTGTITYTVFGPQSTAPTTCTSGGTTVGTATVSGNGTYHPGAAFTPASAGMYWWYASYAGDSDNGSSNSGCGAGMSSTNVAWSLSPTSGTDSTSGSSVALTSTNLTSLQSIDSNLYTTSSWVSTDPFASKNIHGLSWPSASTVYGFGFSGVLLKSTDGGVDWTAQTSGTTNNLTGGACLSTTSCWAAGNSGTILHTTDGSTWTAQTSNTTSNLNDLSCVDSSHCWAVGNGSGPGQPATIDFYNGTAWATQTANTTNNLNGVDCVDASHCWAVGQSGTIDFYNGTSWATQTSNTTGNLNGVYCLDSSHCWAVGNGSGPGAPATIDFYNGTAWATQTSNTTNNLNDVNCLDSSHCWAAGNSGTIDFYNGTSWATQTADSTANNCFSVAFYDTNNGILGCDTKNTPALDLELTQNAGSRWIALETQRLDFQFSPSLSQSATITSVQATVRYQTSAAPSGSSFWLLASPDGGTTWTYYSLPAGSTTATTQTVDLSSLVASVTQLQNLRLRFYISQGSTFTTSHDYVNVAVWQTW